MEGGIRPYSCALGGRTMGTALLGLLLAAAGEVSTPPPMVESGAEAPADVTLARTLKDRMFSFHIRGWGGFEIHKGSTKVEPSIFDPSWVEAFADVPEAFATAQRARSFQAAG